MNDDCCYKLYMHVNKTNGKVYIGQTKLSYHLRWNNGKGYCKCSLFAKAIEKYGWDGFEHLSLIEGLSKIEADCFERFFIAFFDSQNPEYGYNLTAGGDENPMDNPAIREKHREAMKKTYADPEYQKNYREAMKKVYADPEWRENIRKANQKLFTDPKWKEAMKKVYADPEWQKKTRENAKKRCKKVLCVETKIVYDSIKEAAIAVNLKNSTHICLCCRGERAMAGGYHWEYVDEELKNKYVPYASKRKRVLCVETGVIYLSLACAASFVDVTRSTISACCRGRRKTAGGYHWEYV